MIRVLITDDEHLVRSGLRAILEANDDIAVVAEAGDGAEALSAVARCRPQVVLMDVRMPGMDGITAAGRIAAASHAPEVIMLTTFDLDDYVHQALRAGASGFLLKDTPPRDLAAAVRTVAGGDAVLAPTVTRRLIGHFAERGPAGIAAAKTRLEALTPREHEVAVAVARGLSNSEIGRALGMRETTVKTHVSRTLAKLGLSNRVQAAILVHDAGLV